MTTYEIHPAADLFPSMSEEEYQLFREDIATNGQRDAGVVWRGMLIDGRHRMRACSELGIEFATCQLPDDDDPYAFVLSANLRRRHLSTSQRSMIAAKLANLNIGSNQHTTKSEGPQNCVPTQQAADLMNVSPRSVTSAKTVLEKGDAALIKKVESGDVTVSQAAKQVNPADVAKNTKNLAHQYRDRLVRAIDDYHEVVPNYAERDRLVRLVQGVKLW